MHYLNDDYFAELLEEQRLKRLAIDEQVQLEFLCLDEPEITKAMRRRYMERLADRILQIDNLLQLWLNRIELPTDRTVE